MKVDIFNTDKKYNIIYADPPWRYSDKGCSGAAQKHYGTMAPAELAELPIGGGWRQIIAFCLCGQPTRKCKPRLI